MAEKDRGKYFTSESKFWSWLSSQLRKIWRDHPTRWDFIAKTRYSKRIGNRYLYFFKCAMCGEEFQQKHMEIDHIKSCGTVKDPNYTLNMMNISVDDLQALCKPCHGIKTYSDIQGIGLEEARLEKRVIEFGKLKAADQRKVLEEHYEASTVAGNAEGRKQQYREQISSHR